MLAPYYRLKELLRSVKFVLVNPFSTRAYGKKTDELNSDRIARQALAGNVIRSNLPINFASPEELIHALN